jgi:hypothetical protein
MSDDLRSLNTLEDITFAVRRIDELEAKLAKAVEALGRIKRGDFSIMTPPAYVTNPLPSAQEIARTTLAELKGQKDE